MVTVVPASEAIKTPFVTLTAGLAARLSVAEVTCGVIDAGAPELATCAVVAVASGEADLTEEVERLLGRPWDDELEPFRYAGDGNFVRWLNNNISTAIGPSRAHPLTGQILDRRESAGVTKAATLVYCLMLPLPLIAAGDNLAFFPIGPVFRRAGAFFGSGSSAGLISASTCSST